MKRSDYPALYQSADTLSLEYQKKFFRAIFWHLLFLFLAAVISVINSPSPAFAIAQALILLGAFACAVYLFLARPDRSWYGARAIAESIKTITWRYVSRAEPFNGSDIVDHAQFRKRLADILEQNRDVVQRQTANLDGVQVSAVMTDLRQSDVEARRTRYVEARIVKQQHWYAKKAAHNKKIVTWLFVALIATNAIAMAFAIAKVAFPATRYWPTDALVAIAAGLLAWIQAKRYQELSASYTLAAHEISLIREQATHVMTDEELSRFVGDAENAFSREHTLWVARKDT